MGIYRNDHKFNNTMTCHDMTSSIFKPFNPNSGGRVPKLECYADKIREIAAMLGWLTPLYLVCVICQSA